MPAPQDPKLPLRLAYSHREKAEVAMRQCERSFAQGGVDRESHDKLRAGYEREAQLAQRNIQRLIGIEHARMETLEAQRRAALEEQLHLPERVAAGKIDAHAANDTNRRLAQRIAELDGQIIACRARIEAQTSEALGGFIDLPFSDYVSAQARGLDASRQDRAITAVRMRDWYYASLLAIAAAVAVFLPWLSSAGVTTSLLTSDGGLSLLARDAGLPAGFARFAWIFYAILPFLGVLMTASRNAKLLGWGFLFLGLTMLACVTFPGLAIGARGPGPANLAQLLGSFRIGTLVYCASAIGLVVLGAYRISPPGDSLRHAASVSLGLLVSLGCVGLLTALALLGVQGAANVAFSAEFDASQKDRIAFTVRNDGRDPIACFFPLPDHADEMALPAGAAHAFGLRLEIREKGRDVFSAAPPAPYVWNIAQGPLPENQAAIINAGVTLKGSLDLRQLSALGVEPDAVRLQLLARNGALVGEAEIELSGQYLSKPASIRDPLIVTPPPPRPSAQPETAAPAETPAPTTVDVLKVELAGTVGGKALIRVYSQDESEYAEVLAAPGQTVAGGWVLDSIVRRPSSVTMKHTKTGADVQVIRGNIVEIRPSPGR